jgi:predicted PurR-regulated permease PerM
LEHGSDLFEKARQITLKTFGHVLLGIAVVCISWFVCQFITGVVMALLAMYVHNLPSNLIQNGARFLPFVFFVIGIYIIAVFYFLRQRN